MNKDLSVIVGSCDLYSPLWKNFDTMFCRNWELDTEVFFSSESKQIGHARYINVLTNTNNWSDRILETLKKVKTKYVVFILEDYYLTQKITENLINTHIKALDRYNLDKIMLAPLSPFYKYYKDETTNYYKFEQDSPYLASVQPAIWNVLFFKRVLQYRKYSPWEFEIEGSKYIAQYEHNICITGQADVYFNVVRRGFKIVKEWNEFRQKNGLEEFVF